MEQELTSRKIVNFITELNNLVMNSPASTELKLEINLLKNNYTCEYLNTKSQEEKIEIHTKLNSIGKTVQDISCDEVICPDTGKLLKKKSETSTYYLPIETCGHCSICMNAYYYESLNGNYEKTSWPVCFVGRGVICKNCAEQL